MSSDGVGDNVWKVSRISEGEIRLIIDLEFLSWRCLEKKKAGNKACSQSGERSRVMEERGS